MRENVISVNDTCSNIHERVQVVIRDSAKGRTYTCDHPECPIHGDINCPTIQQFRYRPPDES